MGWTSGRTAGPWTCLLLVMLMAATAVSQRKYKLTCTVIYDTLQLLVYEIYRL